MWEETPIQQLWGLVKLKLSIRFWSLVRRAIKVENVSFQLVFQYTHIMTIEFYVCYYKMGVGGGGILTICDSIGDIFYFAHFNSPCPAC